MSAIASFTKLPKPAIEGLRNAAVPKKRLFGAPKDTYHDYLREHGREIVQYRWSGFVLAVLLPYLREKRQIDLMKSEYDELAAFLTQARRASHFFLTRSHSMAFLKQLNVDLFTEVELRDYFNEFNQASDQGVGKAMLDGVTAFRQSLAEVDDSSVVLFVIS